jgi:arylsulfatase A-like enzyme
MGTGCDWFPTLADMCEIAIPQGHRFDGKSLKDVIMQNSDSPHPAFYWHMGGGKNPQWAVRRGNWKLLGNPRDTVSKQPVNTVDGMFLVDLENDPGETTNLAEAEPDKLKEMVRLRGRYLQSIAPQ